jgi:CRP-like cAMP-binding protein
MLRRPVHDCGDCELNAGGKCVFARKTLEPDALIVPQGAVPTEVGFVRRGMIALSTVSRSGDQTWGAVRGPRSLLGVEAVSGSPSACEVRALTEVEICAATVPVVKSWLGSVGGARTLFDLTLIELLEHRRDVDFQTGTAEARVARFALACERYIGTGSRVRPLSKARVAALVGMRPETLSRVLHRFSERGYLDSSSGVRVLDREALEALAEG